MGTENNKGLVKSIDKALNILLLFNKDEKELSHAQISKRLHLSSATTSRLLGTLRSKGFLMKNEENGKYRLGTMIYYLGSIAVNHSELRSCCLPVMERINRITDETLHVFIRDGIHRVCIEKVESHKNIRMTIDIGIPDVLWVGNTGRVLLAYCTDEKREELFRRIHEAAPDLDMDNFRNRVMQVRKKGYGGKCGPWDRHCACVAAPIFDRTGSIIGTLGISVPDFRYPDDDSEYVRMILNGAKEISLQMGWTAYPVSID